MGRPPWWMHRAVEPLTITLDARASELLTSRGVRLRDLPTPVKLSGLHVSDVDRAEYDRIVGAAITEHVRRRVAVTDLAILAALARVPWALHACAPGLRAWVMPRG